MLNAMLDAVRADETANGVADDELTTQLELVGTWELTWAPAFGLWLRPPHPERMVTAF